MRRSTLILVIVLVLALVGGGVFFWLNQDQVKDIINIAPTNTNTGVVANTNTAPIITEVANPVEGDQKLEATIKVNDIDVKLTGLTKAATFESIEAGDGKVFVVVYFMAVEPTQVLLVKSVLQTDSRLTSGTSIYDLAGLKIASTLVKNDHGYFKFVVPDTAKNLELKVGTGDSVQTVKLP